MGNRTDTVGSLLRDVYAPGYETLINTETPFVDAFDTQTSARIVGRTRVRGVRVNRNRGGYYAAESGAPPVAGHVQIEELKVPLRYYYHATQYSEQVLDASQTDEGAFGDVMRIGQEDLLDGIRMQRAFALWHNGTGVRALVNGAASSTTQTFDSPGGIAGNDDGTRFLNEGDWICFVTSGGALRAATAHKITSVVSDTQVVVSPTVSTTDNDYVVRCVETSGTLSIDDTDWQHLPMGAAGMFDNGTSVNLYFSLSRTTFPTQLCSTIIGTAALPVGALSADVMQRCIDVSAKVSGGKISEIWGEPGVKRAYLKMMENDRRYMGTDLRSPNAGTVAAATTSYADTGLSFGTIPIKQDHMAPYQEMLFLDKRGAMRYPGLKGWVEKNGQVLWLSTTSIDTWDSYYRWWENFCHEAPNRCAKLVGVSADYVSVHVI